MNPRRCAVLLLLLVPAAARADARADAADNVAKGKAALNDKDQDLAIAYLTEALRLDPGSSTAYFHRGNAWYDKDEYDRAIADYSDSLRLDQDAATYTNRGLCYSRKKEPDRAIRDFTAALERTGKNPARLYRLRGDAQHDKGDDDQAIADYTEALRNDPKDAEAYEGRGTVYRDKKDYAKALEDYNRAIELKPSASLLVGRGLVHERKKDPDQALADYREAARLDPKDPGAQNALGWLFATGRSGKANAAKEALEHARKACELTGWKKPFYFDTLAAAYALSGDFDSAVLWQLKALASPESFSKDELAEGKFRLRLYEKGKPYQPD
jgi:tetratricopeptide (TPR) repeat protein